MESNKFRISLGIFTAAIKSLIGLSLVYTASVGAEEINIYVALKGSAAYDTATAKANQTNAFAAKSVTSAFTMAGEKLVACKSCTLNIKIAAGDYQGKAKSGHWMFPNVVTPNARLRILGGYDETFTKRSPFINQTRLITAQDRSRPVIQFEGQKHALKELYLSGLTFDVAPGNKYDAKSNSLLKGTSCLYPILSFGYLTTDRLVVADNTFLNGAHTVAQPLIRAMSNEAEILVRNNLIMNTVLAWRLDSPSWGYTIKRYKFENNNFVLNWPYNPDQGTSNPGTLEISGRGAAKQVDITHNLFAYNAGGAIHAQWDDVKGPPIAITNNLFWGNGALFGVKQPDMAAVVGKFNGAARYQTLTAEDAEDFEWDVKGNVSLDPKLHVQIKPFLAAGATKAVMAAGAQAEKATSTSSGTSSNDVSPAPVDPAMAELAALLGNDAVGSANPSADEGVSNEAAEPTADAYAGDNYAELGFGEDGNTKIQNYATRLFIDGMPPFATNPEAKGFGASPNLVEQF